MVRYLVTDNYEQWIIVEAKEEAEKLAIEMVDSDCVVNVYEIKAIGQAFIPDPDPVFEWEV